MKKRFFFLVFFVAAVFTGCEKVGPDSQKKEYFTLWNPCESLTALTEYVTDVTNPKSVNFIKEGCRCFRSGTAAAIPPCTITA